MLVYVVRHAKAGSRSRWDGEDEDRPLTKRGQVQAEAIADRLAGVQIGRIVSSPYVRCVQTVSPLGTRIGKRVREDEALAEGHDWHEALDLVVAARKPLVLCTHGDVLGDLLSGLVRRGVPLDDDRIEKGCTWALQVDDGEVVKATYTPAPVADGD